MRGCEADMVRAFEDARPYMAGRRHQGAKPARMPPLALKGWWSREGAKARELAECKYWEARFDEGEWRREARAGYRALLRLAEAVNQYCGRDNSFAAFIARGQ